MTRVLLRIEMMLMLTMDLERELAEHGFPAHAKEMRQAIAWLARVLKELENA